MPHTASGRHDTDIKWSENVPISKAGFGTLTGQEVSCLMKLCGLAGWWRGRGVEDSISGDVWQGSLMVLHPNGTEKVWEMGWRGARGSGLSFEGAALGWETVMAYIPLCPATASPRVTSAVSQPLSFPIWKRSSQLPASQNAEQPNAGCGSFQLLIIRWDGTLAPPSQG